uniref:Uncharacterized protein n=1 Tax=Nicotiana tabacum TaxID=4097 RepID=A0A1S3XHV0_TOBAC|nr:PREDICTED: uncharacterized protein LOC107765354 [Nicotiana tabacum]
MDSLIGSGFNPYFTEKKGPTITHLFYADDTILFSSCDSLSLNMMMDKLRLYKQVSGQLLNKEKSGFYTSVQDDDPRISEIQRITGFPNCPFPIQTQKTMLKEFLEAKYCKRSHPLANKWAYG